MGKLVNIEKYRVARLADDIEAMLRRNGANGLIVEAASVKDPRVWRRAAVLAAHRLGHRATTLVVEDRIATDYLRLLAHSRRMHGDPKLHHLHT